jgi:hypothetical protein
LCAWALLCALLLFGALAGPYYAGLIYTSDDLGAFHIPLRLFYAQCLAAGEAFDWSPQLFCGFYLSGEGQLGAYHPLHWLLYRTLSLRAALGLEFLLSYPLMFAGGWLLLRRLVDNRAAAAFGALVFTFSGFNLLHFVHPNAIAVVAHIPWLLWLLDVRLRTEDRRTRAAADAGIALLTASQILLGYPQYVWFSLLIEAAFVAYSFFLPSPLTTYPPTPSATCWPPLFRLSLAKLLGLAIGAVQLLPTLDMLATSQRQAADAAFVNSGSLHPLNFVQLIGPYLFATRVAGQNTHELGLYAGAVPLMLVVWLLTQRAHWGDRRRWTLFALGMAAVATLLAMGSYGGLYSLQTYLPLVGKFRMPARHIVLVQLAVAILSAVALAVLIKQAREQRASTWRELGPLWRVAAASAALALVAPWLWREHVASLMLVGIGPLLMLLAAAAVSLAARQVRGAFVLLVVLSAVDLGAYGLSYAVYPQAMRLDSYLTVGPPSPTGYAERIAVDLPKSGSNAPRSGNHLIARGLRQADGYAGLEPRRRLDYSQLPALQIAGVRWLPAAAGAGVAGLVEHHDTWLEVPHPLPRVRLVNGIVASDDPARDLGTIDVGMQALVEHSAANLAPSPGTPGEGWGEGPFERDTPLTPTPLPRSTGERGLDRNSLGNAKLLEDRPGRLTVAIHTTGRQLLVVAESFHSGWQATIDGVPTAVLRVNGDFLGTIVEPGRHQVSLLFRPWSLTWGRRLSLIGLALLAAWVAVRLGAVRKTTSAGGLECASDRRAKPPASGDADCREGPREPLSCDTILIPRNLIPRAMRPTI